jgi:hypothetical protein
MVELPFAVTASDASRLADASVTLTPEPVVADVAAGAALDK